MQSEKPGDEIPLGNPRAGESVFDQFGPPQDALAMGEDGMPVAVDPPFEYGASNAPPLTAETLICMQQDGVKKCKFYKRQRVHTPETPDRPLIERFCTHKAMRGINGACLSIRDTAIYECELRRPKVARCTAILDAIDAVKIDQGRERMRVLKEEGGERAWPIFRTVDQAKAGIYECSDDDAVLVSPTGEIMESTK